jgi:adenylyltransferase/sulfurtransferase
MASDDEEQALRDHQKVLHKLVAKSWLDPTIRDRLRKNPSDALEVLGVGDLTEAEAAAVARFTDHDIDHDIEPPAAPWRASVGARRTDQGLDEGRRARLQQEACTSGRASDAETEFSMERPRLATHVYVRVEPPDPSGVEGLHVVSSRRQLKLEGRGLRSFHEVVLPLLDGRHTMAEIEAASRPRFHPDELRRGLLLLASHDLLRDASKDVLAEPALTQLAPQLNFFHEMGQGAQETQARLASATVTVFGMGGAGAAACLSLAAAHVGKLRCIDASPVLSTDPTIAPTFPAGSVGRPRAEIVADMAKAVAPDLEVTSCTDVLATDDDVLEAIDGSDFVLCCIDPGLASLAYKINRACLRAGISWTACSASAFEGVVGPTVEPFDTACYLCYQMREAACAEHPEEALAHLEFLDARKTDDSGVREGHAFAAGATGNLAALEAFKKLSGVIDLASSGHIVVLDFLRLATTRHRVLRKPDCPACSRPKRHFRDPSKH